VRSYKECRDPRDEISKEASELHKPPSTQPNACFNIFEILSARPQPLLFTPADDFESGKSFLLRTSE